MVVCWLLIENIVHAYNSMLRDWTGFEVKTWKIGSQNFIIFILFPPFLIYIMHLIFHIKD